MPCRCRSFRFWGSNNGRDGSETMLLSLRDGLSGVVSIEKG
jgi:hypothetical protein